MINAKKEDDKRKRQENIMVFLATAEASRVAAQKQAEKAIEKANIKAKDS